jgi:beta-mannosidase
MKQLCLILVGFISSLLGGAQNRVVPLELKWEFRQKGKADWHKASVPGTVHTDLFTNGMIADPFYGSNEKELQWIENEDWEYRSVFEADSVILSFKRVELTFEGLDTYAKVYVNDSLVLVADNMFRTWQPDVRRLLHKGQNTLYLLFESAVKEGKHKATELPYTLPEGERVFSRKAQYHYGWDWGPRFVTCGIWKPLSLVMWNDIKIESVNYRIRELNSSLARVDLIFRTHCNNPGRYNFECVYATGSFERSPAVTFKTKFLRSGLNSDTVECVIKDPKLWWCNGMGQQPLYTMKYTVKNDDRRIAQGGAFTLGIRTVELVTKPDSAGAAFYFKVNGVPVFMKGANYIPQDNFLSRVTGDFNEEIVHAAKRANMNMLRVWGGGTYASDEFYAACDKAGILVWQDLMFACAMYPVDKAFVENVKAEVKQQALRISQHPCLALWCGNNECDEGWKNWGWQKQFRYSKKDSLVIWKNYQKLFHEAIPSQLRECDPLTAYHPSSPMHGWGRAASMREGDSHYWGVWWGMEPFSAYTHKVGRFMSEYGFQGMPDVSTFRRCCDKDALTLNSADVRAHQKHKTGYQTINTYMQRHYKVPGNFEDYIYTSQLLQRDGLKTAIEAHHAARPRCMGTLFWQFNDCWPVTSWSVLDYYHTPKASYFGVQRAFASRLVLAAITKTTITVSAISDSLDVLNAQVRVSLYDFFGNKYWDKTWPVELNGNVNATRQISRSELPLFDSAAVVLQTELISNGKCLARDHYFFTAPKHLKLPEATLRIQRENNTTISVVSDVFAKDVFLSDESGRYRFGDNYFNLVPGEKKMVKVSGAAVDVYSPPIKTIVLNNL